MGGHDFELREIGGHLIQISGVAVLHRGFLKEIDSHMQDDRDIQLDAFGIQGVIPAISGAQFVQKRPQVQALETQLTHSIFELAHGIHSLMGVCAGEADEPLRCPAAELGQPFIGNPGAESRFVVFGREHNFVDPGLIYQLQKLLRRHAGIFG